MRPRGYFPPFTDKAGWPPPQHIQRKVGDAAADGRRRGESTVEDKRDILVIGCGDSDIDLAASAREARD